MKDVRNRTAVITGGGAGMGRLWAARFLKDGARVSLWDINADAAAAAAAALAGIAGAAAVHTQVVDVSDTAAMDRAVDATIARFGQVDVLVNNAGIIDASLFEDTPDDLIDRVIRVNLTAQMQLAKRFVGPMIERNRGHVINISSASGMLGVPRMAAYVASKWGMIGFSETLKAELRLRGITGVKVTCVCPSYVNTGMFHGARPPKFSRLLEPHEVVDVAYEAFRRDKFLVVEPFLAKTTPFARALLPQIAQDAVLDWLGVTGSMTDFTGHRR